MLSKKKQGTPNSGRKASQHTPTQSDDIDILTPKPSPNGDDLHSIVRNTDGDSLDLTARDSLIASDRGNPDISADISSDRLEVIIQEPSSIALKESTRHNPSPNSRISGGSETEETLSRTPSQEDLTQTKGRARTDSIFQAKADTDEDLTSLEDTRPGDPLAGSLLVKPAQKAESDAGSEGGNESDNESQHHDDDLKDKTTEITQSTDDEADKKKPIDTKQSTEQHKIETSFLLGTITGQYALKPLLEYGTDRITNQNSNKSLQDYYMEPVLSKFSFKTIVFTVTYAGLAVVPTKLSPVQKSLVSSTIANYAVEGIIQKPIEHAKILLNIAADTAVMGALSFMGMMATQGKSFASGVILTTYDTFGKFSYNLVDYNSNGQLGSIIKSTKASSYSALDSFTELTTGNNMQENYSLTTSYCNKHLPESLCDFVGLSDN